MSGYMPSGPKHIPTADTRYIVRSMTEHGYLQREICERLGVKSELTLRKYYPDEIKASVIDRHVRVAETLYSIATDRDHPRCTTAAIFIAKTRMGWIDPVRIIHGGSVNTNNTHNFNATNLSPEQREQLRELLIAATPQMLLDGPAIPEAEYTEYEYEEEDEE